MEEGFYQNATRYHTFKESEKIIETGTIALRTEKRTGKREVPQGQIPAQESFSDWYKSEAERSRVAAMDLLKYMIAEDMPIDVGRLPGEFREAFYEETLYNLSDMGGMDDTITYVRNPQSPAGLNKFYRQDATKTVQWPTYPQYHVDTFDPKFGKVGASVAVATAVPSLSYILFLSLLRTLSTPILI